MSRSRRNSGKRWGANGSRFHRGRGRKRRDTGGYFLSRLIPSEIDSPVKKSSRKRRTIKGNVAGSCERRDLPQSSFLYFSFPPPLFLSVSSFPSLPLLFFQSARFHATHDPRVLESRSMFRHQVFRIPFRFDTPLSGVWARLIVSYSISLHYGGYVRGITTGGIIFRSTFIYFVLWPPNVPFSYIYVYMLCVNYHDSRENVK